ncbi:flagellar hook-associated protein FlgL [Halobacillus yeomjeoni]|uniref:Flagellar hook-associated protein FlgL n=1 Tax=Halobacillus yeomjeoni TaxID=311194 RepID=A0A931MVQ8_9BACI|nr:flagellar hook-associated protein FlgL [Halobacillus yeomjeoni]MBH0230880.1 flagellar hook-associated protein FlgL [Halobacillus yeomjeoni]
MRITQSMLSNNMLRNLSKSYENMDKYQQQLSTGKKIHRPSDDPVIAMKSVNYRTQKTEIEQYKRNMTEVNIWMDNSDSSLDKATKTMQRIRELNVQASNGTYDSGQRENVAKEVRQLIEHMENVGNSKINGKYLFNGANTKTAPVSVKDNTFPDNSDPVKMEVSQGVFLKANVDGTQVFNEELFNDLNEFASTLESGSEKGLDQFLAKFDGHIDNIVNERADLGARMNRVELVEDRLETQEIIANRVLSDNEDAELEKVITDLKTQESVHRAAMGVGARIIQPTLMDFLR